MSEEPASTWSVEDTGLPPTNHDESRYASIVAIGDRNAERITRDGDRPDEATEETECVFTRLSEFNTYDFPRAEPLLGEPGAVYLAAGSLLLPYGAEGSGKTTWTIDGIAHMAAGVDWLELPVPRPVRFMVIENEGPPALFQEKLWAKQESWQGPDFANNVHVFAKPWSKFSFADAGFRRALTEYSDENEIDVVVANPMFGVGGSASGRPDETQEFVDLLAECGLRDRRAFWPLHHENKAGQISGDWGRHADTLVLLEPDGNRQRTKLTWKKTRWVTPGSEGHPRTVMLDWVVETEGYNVTEIDAAGASDPELVERLVDYLHHHPAASTRQVQESVKGTNRRISRLLEERPEFDRTAGKGGAKLWIIASTASEGAPTRQRSEPESSSTSGIDL